MKERVMYEAVYHFLDEHYKRQPSDGLRQLLSDMSLDIWADGEPADPAIKQEWEKALLMAKQRSTVQDDARQILRKVS